MADAQASTEESIKLMSGGSSQNRDNILNKMDCDEKSVSKDRLESEENIENKNREDVAESVALKMRRRESEMKLRRFCYLGTFTPVYMHLRRYIVVKELWPVVKELVKYVKDKEFLQLMREVLIEVPGVRRDEALFIYAAYLASPIDMECKTSMRLAFPALIRTDDDLFLFCKYTSLICKEEKRKCFSRTVRKAIKAWYEMQPAEAIRAMWLSHRGLHKFTHKALIKLCHISDINIGSAEVVKPFFKTCTEIVKEAEPNAEVKNTAEPAQSAGSANLGSRKLIEQLQIGKKKSTASPTPTSVIVAVSKLRTTKSRHEAIKIIRKFKLSYSQVPGHWLRFPVIMEAVLPTMSYLQILKCWRKMTRFNHFENNPKIFKICKKKLENLEFAKASRVYPVHILMGLHDIGKEALCNLPEEKVKASHLDYLNKLYTESFNWPAERGKLRMHITLNLQTNYKKKLLRNHKKMNFYDASIALSFGYCKREKLVHVFHWYEEKFKLKQIPFEKNYTIEMALNACDMVVNNKNNQRLVTPIMNALKSEQVYDVFLCIVPTAGRGNPKQNSDFLCTFLDKYRLNKNPNARFIILDLLKFNRPSMSYSVKRTENILEICGLDENTTNIIHNFATHRFD